MTNPTPNTLWHDVCAVDDVNPQFGKLVMLEKRSLAIFRTGEGDDDFRVVDDVCPHAGASLAAGFVQGDCVLCPWHGWAFNVDDGKCPDNPSIAVDTFPVRIEAGRIFVQLPSADDA